MSQRKRAAKNRRPKVIPIRLDATFFFERAVQSLDRYHYDKALKYFRRAVEYEPENPVNHCNMAGILSEMGRYEESNDILRSVLDRIDPAMTYAGNGRRKRSIMGIAVKSIQDLAPSCSHRSQAAAILPTASGI